MTAELGGREQGGIEGLLVKEKDMGVGDRFVKELEKRKILGV